MPAALRCQLVLAVAQQRVADEGFTGEHHAFLFERMTVRVDTRAGPHAHEYRAPLAAAPQLADAHAGAEVVPAGVVAGAEVHDGTGIQLAEAATQIETRAAIGCP